MDRPLAADRLFERMEMTLDRLLDFPDSGRAIPEYPNSLHREVLVYPLRFFYLIQGDTIYITDVYHQAQLPDRLDT